MGLVGLLTIHVIDHTPPTSCVALCTSDTRARSSMLSASDIGAAVTSTQLGDHKRGRDDGADMGAAAASADMGGGNDGAMVYDQEAKRARIDNSNSHVLKILVANAVMGSLIGKQGVVLKQIMDGSGCRIKISSTDEVIPKTGERVAQIVGSLQGLTRAQQLISQQLLVAAQSPNGAPDEATVAALVDVERTVKILIPNHSCGLIIGKGGSLIKELMEKSGASVRVSQPADVIAPTQERVVTVTGVAASVDVAQAWLCETLAQAPLSQQPKSIDYGVLKQAAAAAAAYAAPPAPYGAPPAHNPYAYAAPAGYSYAPPPHAAAAPPPPRAPPMDFASFVATLPGYMEPAEQLTRYQGYLSQHQAALAAASAPSSYAPPQQSSYAPPRPAPGGGGGGAHSLNIQVPDRQIPGIIGKGGSVIRDIASRSGAQVRVSQKETVNAAGERTVMIEAPTAEIAANAQQMVLDKLRENEAAAGNRGGGGGGGGAPSSGGYGYAPPPPNPYAQPPPYAYQPQPAADPYAHQPAYSYSNSYSYAGGYAAPAPAPPPPSQPAYQPPSGYQFAPQ